MNGLTQSLYKRVALCYVVYVNFTYCSFCITKYKAQESCVTCRSEITTMHKWDACTIHNKEQWGRNSCLDHLATVAAPKSGLPCLFPENDMISSPNILLDSASDPSMLEQDHAGVYSRMIYVPSMLFTNHPAPIVRGFPAVNVCRQAPLIKKVYQYRSFSKHFRVGGPYWAASRMSDLARC